MYQIQLFDVQFRQQKWQHSVQAALKLLGLHLDKQLNKQHGNSLMEGLVFVP